MILTHTALDIFFIVAYAVLTASIIIGVVAQPPLSPVMARRKVRLLVLLGILVLVDLAEDTLLVTAAMRMADGVPVSLAGALAIVSTVKWVVTIWLGGGVLLSAPVLTGLRDWLRNAGAAIRVHPLAFVVVLILIVLSLLPLNLVLEQQPDIERTWFDSDGYGIPYGVAACGAIVVLGVGYLLVGRKLSQDYYRRAVLGIDSVSQPRSYTQAQAPWLRWPRLLYVLWFALPAGFLVLGWLFRQSRPDLVNDQTFAAFVIVTAIIPASSLVIEGLWRWRNTFAMPFVGPPVPDPSKLPRALFVARTGDLLALMMIGIAALGLTRALTPLIVLAATGQTPQPDPQVWFILVQAAFAGAGIATTLFVVSQYLVLPGAFFAPPVLPAGVVANFRREFRPNYVPPTPSKTGLVIAGAGVLTCVALITLAVLLPMTTGSAIGVIAMLVLSVGAWTLLVSLLALVLRWRRPLALFELLGLRTDPILTLLIVVPVIISLVVTNVPNHRIDQSAAATDPRPSLDAAFASWAQRSADCTASGPDGTYQPMVLIAAEGGGIRAATWTAAVLAEVEEDGPCTAGSVFLSSGVSGGSVGLAVAANASDPNDMRESIRDLSRSTALPTAVSGMAVTDPLASTTGLRVPSAESPDRWRDRASLIEESWRVAMPELRRPFGVQFHSPTGYVVLNSTDLRSGCRVSISQIRLDEGSDADGTGGAQFTTEGPSCKVDVDEPALTVDLISAYRRCGEYRGDWATSAMLSARFGYVTPSGDVEIVSESGQKCEGTRLQLLDGGYAENSGLGLLADIAPRLASLIRIHNDSHPDQPIVPFVMYVQNSPGGYIAQSPRNNTNQIAVPILGQGTKQEQLAPTSWIQRIQTSLAEAGELPVSVADRTVIAAVATKPAVNVPLGWGLSAVTYAQLVTDADDQADHCLRSSETHACLADLLALQ